MIHDTIGSIPSGDQRHRFFFPFRDGGGFRMSCRIGPQTLSTKAHWIDDGSYASEFRGMPGLCALYSTQPALQTILVLSFGIWYLSTMPGLSKYSIYHDSCSSEPSLSDYEPYLFGNSGVERTTIPSSSETKEQSIRRFSPSRFLHTPTNLAQLLIVVSLHCH